MWVVCAIKSRGGAEAQNEVRVIPSRPKRPCSYSGCSELVAGGRCEKHKKQEQRRYDERRGTRTQRGYSNRWLRASKAFLAKNPLCAECERQGRLMPATLVDHIKPHKGDYHLFWDENNWQSLCASCHSRKTVNEDGGFGRV